MKLKLKGYILAFVSAVTYGMIPLFMIPIKESGFSLDASLFYRFSIASVFIAGYLLYKKENLKVTILYQPCPLNIETVYPAVSFQGIRSSQTDAMPCTMVLYGTWPYFYPVCIGSGLALSALA